ncbi:hypothetical protein LR48_Vigan05g055300 [Vigna angularis]|uniref:Uncharacterized protein n=1 Tax=Phaseolus angularis TaxID=3914 RepID=A0A0L9UK71_PHAAN|nr:uncharacterized protein HKW66_Vig0209780 [Vigna angularis]KOM42949.1 hypothetical protein LR48_Vigan05g055300 [Vigna angularis]
MSHHHEGDAEYMADECEMEDVKDDVDDESIDNGERGGVESDADEFDYSVRRGQDIQGIPWDNLSITRERYRRTRLEQYKNYENIPGSGDKSGKLRNLVWATSKHDVYLMSQFSIMHWSSMTCKSSEVLDVSGHVAPSEKHPESLLEGFTHTQVSTLAVREKLLVAGGFQGELIFTLPDAANLSLIGIVHGFRTINRYQDLISFFVTGMQHLNRPGVSFCTRTTFDDNAITNAIEIYTSPSGAVHFTAANNDSGVRDFDMEKFQLSNHFRFPWPVNHTSLSPNGKLLLIVGDNPEGMLVDSQNGKTVVTLSGHFDYSFASSWHPDGMTFATGNQDKTCRIWDMRNLSKSVGVLKSNLGAIRSIRYSSDGKYMAVAEPADFVHVYDVKGGYEKEQEIDFFGEISGISFSPDTESLFIGVWDRTYGSLLEYIRRRNYTYLDALI